jgi:hypothetical protein
LKQDVESPVEPRDEAKSDVYSLSLIVTILFGIFCSSVLILQIVSGLASDSNFNLRISIQSRSGHVLEPSNSANLITILAFSTVFFALILMSNKSKHNYKIFIKIFAKLQYPTALLIIIFFANFFFAKIDLKGLGNNPMDILNSFISVPILEILYSIIVITVSNLILASALRQWLIKKESYLDSISINLSLHITISLFLFHSVIKSSEVKVFLFQSSSLFLFLAIFIFSPILAISLTLCSIKFKLFYIFSLFPIVFYFLYINRPISLLSWRPDFKLIQLSEYRFLVFSLFIAGVICLILLLLKPKIKSIFVKSMYAALFILINVSSPSNEVAFLDNFHYGERIGLWYNYTKNQLDLYNAFELPRGYLVNIFPAKLSNFLSPGNPELYKYSYFLLFILIVVLFCILLHGWLPTEFIILLGLLIPAANGYNEIDYLSFLFVLFFFRVWSSKNYQVYAIPTLVWGLPVLILLFPGQGTLIIFCLFLTLLLTIFKQNAVLNLTGKSWLLILASLPVYLYFFDELIGAIRWGINNSKNNQFLFSDGWLEAYLLSPEQFPISLKWIPVYFCSGLIWVIYICIKRRYYLETYIALFALFYVILISGRWLGRVDVNNNSLSRIGFGTLSLALFILIPLAYRLYLKRFFPRVYIFFILLIVLPMSIQLKSYEPLFRDFDLINSSQPPDLVYTENDYTNRGSEYKRFLKVVNDLALPKKQALNLTGGTANDFYLQIPSLGGIASPYLIVEDSQEQRWIDRLKDQNLVWFYGPYGSLGGLRADDSSISTRAPNLFNWLFNNFKLVQCDTFLIGISKNEFKQFDKKLNRLGCKAPNDSKEEFELWVVMNGGNIPLDQSLINWKLEDSFPYNTYITPKVIQIDKMNKIKVFCDSISYSKLKLYGQDKQSKKNLEFDFEALTKSGQLTFRGDIFPIYYFVSKLFLDLRDSNCVHIP